MICYSTRFDRRRLGNVPPTILNSCINLVKDTKETFFLPHPFAPRTDMESLAAAVFDYHTRGLGPIPQNSGAEFWCQVKPPGASQSVDLHYDKDEQLSESFALGSFPFLSTVTYLTGGNVGTAIFQHSYGEEEEKPIPECTVAYPEPGKHVVFDGELLHGAPDDPEFKAFWGRGDDRSTRVTFLVNLWLGGRPAIEQLSEEERSKLGGAGGAPVEFIEDKKRQIVEVGESNLSGEGIQLPFVLEDDGEEGQKGLVLAMPSLPGKAKNGNVVFRFKEGYEAMLLYIGEEEEDEDDEEMEMEIEIEN